MSYSRKIDEKYPPMCVLKTKVVFNHYERNFLNCFVYLLSDAKKSKIIRNILKFNMRANMKLSLNIILLTGLVRYIGQTKNLEKRIAGHRSFGKSNKYFKNREMKIFFGNNKNLTITQSIYYEQTLIRYFQKYGHLINVEKMAPVGSLIQCFSENEDFIFYLIALVLQRSIKKAN